MDKESDSFLGLFSRESEVDEDAKLRTSEQEDQQYIATLMERETELDFTKRQSQSLVFDLARSEAISYTIQVSVRLGFRFQTAYLSMTYYDRFLSRRPISSEEMWLMKLLPAACLVLAAKMEEPVSHPLSNFRMEDDDFGAKLIGRMELYVVSTLEWKMNTITPFSFLQFFVTRFSLVDQSPQSLREILTRTASLVIATIREINLMEHRPSSIAAAATMVALGQDLTNEALKTKMNSISQSQCQSIQIEDVVSCHSVLSKLKIDQETAALSTILETSSITNALSNERKRGPSRNCSSEYGMKSFKRFR